MVDYALEIEGLSYRYADGTLALDQVNLKVPKGSRTALLGPNGAGKTTLLYHLNGLFLPQRGRVVVMGQEVNRASQRRIKSRVGLVFQDPDDQLFGPSVWDDVAFGPANLGLDREEVEQRVSFALEALGISELAARPPHRLSLGQKKRVAIAGVLAMDPDILVLDEPTAFLDPAGQEELLQVLEGLHRQGRTLVMATHDVDLAAEWAQEVIVLVEGRVIAWGPVRLLTDEDLVYRARLRLPSASRLFLRLRERGQYEGDLPLTLEEAAELLASGRLEYRHVREDRGATGPPAEPALRKEPGLSSGL